MIKSTLERIETRGHWRVRFRPEVDKLRFPSAAVCEEVVARNCVGVRAWEFPAVFSGSPLIKRENLEDGYAQAMEVRIHLETWKMFRSGEFVDCLALRDDWLPGPGSDARPRDVAAPAKFSFEDALVVAADIYDFLHTLTRSRVYDVPVEVTIELHGLKGRAIWVGHGRSPLYHEYIASEDSFTWVRTHSPDDMLIQIPRLSAGLLVALFGAFGWKLSVDRMDEEVERLFSRVQD